MTETETEAEAEAAAETGTETETRDRKQLAGLGGNGNGNGSGNDDDSHRYDSDSDSRSASGSDDDGEGIAGAADSNKLSMKSSHWLARSATWNKDREQAGYVLRPLYCYYGVGDSALSAYGVHSHAGRKDGMYFCLIRMHSNPFAIDGYFSKYFRWRYWLVFAVGLYTLFIFMLLAYVNIAVLDDTTVAAGDSVET